MPDRIIGHLEFVDGRRRPIYEDERGQFAMDDEGCRVDGVWLIPPEEQVDLPIIVGRKQDGA
jgi:hypothetical protein